MKIVNIQPITDENYDQIRDHDKYGLPLTNKEIEVLHMITKGLSDQDIATEMGTAHQTVKNHLNNIYKKLNINSSRQLMAAYIQHITGEHLLPEEVVKL